MAEIDRFSGMVISMYCEVGGKHHWPHIHVRSGDGDAVYRLNGQLVEGSLPSKKDQEIREWLVAHKKALNKIYKMAHAGKKILSVREVEAR